VLYLSRHHYKALHKVSVKTPSFLRPRSFMDNDILGFKDSINSRLTRFCSEFKNVRIL